MKLTIVYPLARDAVDEQALNVDIVAVHGIGGHPLNTWTRNHESNAPTSNLESEFGPGVISSRTSRNVLWLQDVLPLDLPTARIMAFGYEIPTAFNAVTDITKISKALLSHLLEKRKEDIGHRRPIVFFAHSTGGLIVKQALTYAENDDKFNILSKVTAGVIFFGTPHRGGQHIRYGDLLQKVANVTSERNNSGIKQLPRDNDALARLNTESNHQLSRYRVASFYENLETVVGTMSSLIVSKHSAVLDARWETQIAVDANHRDICKFISKEDKTYQRCLTFIQDTLEKFYDLEQKALSVRDRNQYWMVPYDVCSGYTDRKDIEKELEKGCLPSESLNKFHRCHVLYGLGGSGKTQICLKFAQDHRDAFWGIFWIDACTEASIIDSSLKIARRLGLVEEVPSVIKYLSEVAAPWLLIIDNANDPSVGLSKYFPTGGKGSTLITSRSARSAIYATVGSTSIDTLSLDEAIELLLRAAGGVVDSNDEARESAKSIVSTLGGLPLALTQAGTYIKWTGCSVKEYLETYQIHLRRSQQRSSPGKLSNNYETISRCLEIAFNCLENLGTEMSLDALDILGFLAFVSDGINVEELFEKAWVNEMKHPQYFTPKRSQLRILCNPTTAPWQPFRLRNAMDLLASYSVIQLGQEKESVSIHPVIKRALYARLSKDEMLKYFDVTASTLIAAAGADLEAEAYGFREALLSHINVFLALHDDHVPEDIDFVTWTESLSSFSATFRDGGQHQRALELETRAMKLRGHHLGGEDIDTLKSMHRISHQLLVLKRPQEAATMAQTVLQKRQETLGIEHLESLESMECLASSYGMLGKLQEAISLLEYAVDVRRRNYREAEHEIITDMSHLAAYYGRSGRLLEALELGEAVFSRRRESLGQTHPDTLISMNNLAVSYEESGRLSDAVILHEKVVSISEQIFGNGHPSSMAAMHNLAASYTSLAKHSEAVALEVKVLDLRRVHLGKLHPETLRAMDHLGIAYEAAGQREASLALREDLMQKSEIIYGHDHPAMWTVMADLATAKETNGNYQDAIELREKLLQLSELQFGAGHPQLLTARSDLATSYQITGQLQKAAELRQSLYQASDHTGEAQQSGTRSQLYSAADEDRLSSDSDTTCSEESVFSQAASGSSEATSSASRSTPLQIIATKFENDPEIVFAYEDLKFMMSRQKFVRKHAHLLKSYFKNLHPKTSEERQAIDSLRRRRQRTDLSASIYDRNWPSGKSLQALREAANVHLTFDRLELPVNQGERGKLSMVQEVESLHFSDQEQSSDENDDDENASCTVNHESSVSEVDGLMKSHLTFLKEYKVGLHELAKTRCSPRSLHYAMKFGNIDTVRGLLERHFKALAVNEFKWLQELSSLGYGHYDIAELLLDDMTQSPWIFFKQPEPRRVAIRADFHTLNCVHQGGKKTDLVPKLVTDGMENTEDLKKLIAEHCGLAGVIPKSRDTKAWTGLVTFSDQERSTASITYETLNSRLEIVSRVCEALERFCGIVSYLQEKSFCCNSLTVLRFASSNGSTVIELCSIAFEVAADLLVVVQLLANNWESPGLISRCCPRLSKLADKIISAVCDAIPANDGDLTFQRCLDKVSLAVQILTLGVYSYSQAHTGVVHPFFLISPLSEIHLMGMQIQHHSDARAYVRMSQYRLTCMAGVVGDAVNVFGSPQISKTPDAEQAFDLLACPAEIAETWDAWSLISDPIIPYEEGLYAIEVAEGFISAASEFSAGNSSTATIPRLHWSKGEPSLEYKRPFSLYAKARIGATAINTLCPVDEHQSWMCATGAMETLGATECYWERSEAQAGFQTGQYVIAQFNMTWIKRPGTTLKHIHLRPDINLPFLQSDWGLQISYCTGVARRVSLCNLLADITPILIEGLLQQPLGWHTLRFHHNFVDALQSSNFKAWFDQLIPELQSDVLRIVRYVLLILQDTGIDQSGDHLVAIWPRKGNPLGCFKIPCKDATFWARMLQDSSDCATFAYVTPLCLETNEWKCQNLQTAPWHNRSVVLDTAVSLHKSGAASLGQWRLKHEQSYVIGQPGKYLLGKVSISDPAARMQIPPHLDISRSIIPASLQARIKEHLREKQCANAPAHGVIVVARHPQLFSLGF